MKANSARQLARVTSIGSASCNHGFGLRSPLGQGKPVPAGVREPTVPALPAKVGLRSRHLAMLGQGTDQQHS